MINEKSTVWTTIFKQNNAQYYALNLDAEMILLSDGSKSMSDPKIKVKNGNSP